LNTAGVHLPFLSYLVNLT